MPSRQTGSMNAHIELMPVSLLQASIARHAWRVFGRGIHPACLNYGDCFAYALAKETREPLLFKGNDFAQTDIESALRN
jgi:ribonuclease VapC